MDGPGRQEPRTSKFEPRTSRVDVQSFVAFVGPPRRRGRSRLEQLARSDQGGRGIEFGEISAGSPTAGFFQSVVFP
eukprot:4926994-Pyramimonas_sp.AAC.1